ncbi:MAG: DUF4157 domain-containing protein [Proteobacteria bacterium]|nr:DUF4157 domain-containing protein [Pseudomonadota bacterium]
MSRYFFDDSKDHDYEDEFERPGPIYQPAISPGKVTLTSRIVRAAPPPTNNAPAKSSQPSATPVQRKAETTPPIATVLDSKMSAWDLAVRPDLYSPPETDATPIQRKEEREPEQEVSLPQPSGSGTALPDDVRAQMEEAFGADFSTVRIPLASGGNRAAIGGIGNQSRPDTGLAANALALARTGWQGPLPFQAEMEAHFGISLDNVSAFFGPEAAQACEMVGAQAFTVGNIIAFSEDSPSKKVVQHELTHVIQQGGHEVALGSNPDVLASAFGVHKPGLSKIAPIVQEGYGWLGESAVDQLYKLLPPDGVEFEGEFETGVHEGQ